MHWDAWKQSWQQASQSGNFSEFNKLVMQDVNRILGNADREVEQARRQAFGSEEGQWEAQDHDRQRPAATRAQAGQTGYGATHYSQLGQVGAELAQALKRGIGSLQSNQPWGRRWLSERFKKKEKDRGEGGMVLAILGWLAAFGLLSVGWADLILGPLVMGGACAVGATAVFLRARRSLARMKLAGRYLELMDKKTYINTHVLAEMSHRSESQVAEDLMEMIRRGIFPQGHMDREGKCFMLDDQTFKEYLALEQERRQWQQPAEKMVETAAISTEEEEAALGAELSPEERKEWLQMLRQGEDCIRQLAQLNLDIPGEVLSLKMDRLEALLREIFGRVKTHPRETKQMQKFMDYYLPTVLRLGKSYREFDAISDPGENIRKAKEDIEAAFDVVNEAFAKFLDQLYQYAAMDIAADAQVLKSMLVGEGLSGGMISGDK